MSGRVVIGLFDTVEGAAAAVRALRALPLPEERITTLSSVPLPDGAVTRSRRPVRFQWLSVGGWFVGAGLGLALALITYLDYPLITGGEALISVPPAIIVTYEGSMFGAIVTTLIAAFATMGLARRRRVFDPRVHDGKIAVCAAVEAPDQERAALEALRAAGGTDVRAEEGEL